MTRSRSIGRREQRYLQDCVTNVTHIVTAASNREVTFDVTGLVDPEVPSSCRSLQVGKAVILGLEAGLVVDLFLDLHLGWP